MKITNIFFFLFSVVILVGLSGCASYKARPLKPLTTLHISGKPKDQSVEFAYHVFTKKDCKKYLDRDVIAKGYQPIHITITNHSNSSFDFNLANLSLQTVPADVVAQEVHTSTVARAVGYGVAGLFIWPLLIPAVVDGVGSVEANQKLDRDFDYKVLRNETIPAHGTINGLIFVARDDYKQNFSVTLLNKDTHKKLVLYTTTTVSA